MIYKFLGETTRYLFICDGKGRRSITLVVYFRFTNIGRTKEIFDYIKMANLMDRRFQVRVKKTNPFSLMI